MKVFDAALLGFFAASAWVETISAYIPMTVPYGSADELDLKSSSGASESYLKAPELGLNVPYGTVRASISTSNSLPLYPTGGVLPPRPTAASRGTKASDHYRAFPKTFGTGTAIMTAPSSVKTHKVEVGGPGQLSFRPNSVNAALGDVVEFNFLALNHTLTQSSFDKPCTYNGGIDSRFHQFNPKNISGRFIKSITVKESRPMWFYCKQGNHCLQGMVFGINLAGKMDRFIKNARAVGQPTNKTN